MCAARRTAHWPAYMCTYTSVRAAQNDGLPRYATTLATPGQPVELFDEIKAQLAPSRAKTLPVRSGSHAKLHFQLVTSRQEATACKVCGHCDKLNWTAILFQSAVTATRSSCSSSTASASASAASASSLSSSSSSSPLPRNCSWALAIQLMQPLQLHTNEVHALRSDSRPRPRPLSHTLLAACGVTGIVHAVALKGGICITANGKLYAPTEPQVAAHHPNPNPNPNLAPLNLPKPSAQSAHLASGCVFNKLR